MSRLNQLKGDREMFVNYNLGEIKNGKISLNKEVQEDVMLIVQSFENECIDITNWSLFEIAATHRTYGFENKNDMVYMEIKSTGEVLPCYFKNHDLNAYGIFVADSINEAIKLYERTYKPKPPFKEYKKIDGPITKISPPPEKLNNNKIKPVSYLIHSIGDEFGVLVHRELSENELASDYKDDEIIEYEGQLYLSCILNLATEEEALSAIHSYFRAYETLNDEKFIARLNKPEQDTQTVKDDSWKEPKQRRIGYVFSFNLRGVKKDSEHCGEIYSLDVNVVPNYDVNSDTDEELYIDGISLSDFIIGYLDLGEEVMKFTVKPNPYFDSVTITGYYGGFSINSWLEPEEITKDKCEQLLKEYFSAVKNDNAFFERTGESVAYFYVDMGLEDMFSSMPVEELRDNSDTLAKLIKESNIPMYGHFLKDYEQDGLHFKKGEEFCLVKENNNSYSVETLKQKATISLSKNLEEKVFVF
ncbi:hypothetical protein ACIQZG_22580 [Lysinibacillus sp. NPDC096418]|uniref:hypothetical protein n=1 Tax=Lysinibacillus sp. NPDC096418 TaxID=3364138 RepID=UPI00380996B5